MTSAKLLLTLAVLAGGFAFALCVERGIRFPDEPATSLSPPLPDCAAMTKRPEAKELVIAGLMKGRLTLFEAAASFRVLDAQPPGPTPRPRLAPHTVSDAEDQCRHVISWACESVGGDEGKRLRLRLEEELNEHLEAHGGAVILPALAS